MHPRQVSKYLFSWIHCFDTPPTILTDEKLSAEDLAALEALGVAGVRDRLASSSGDRLFATHGPFREVALQWLDRKQATSERWVKLGTVAAIVAAVASVIDLLR